MLGGRTGARGECGSVLALARARGQGPQAALGLSPVLERAARCRRPQLRALAEELRAEHIHVSIRGSALRISPHLWAGERDVERLFDAIARREELLAR